MIYKIGRKLVNRGDKKYFEKSENFSSAFTKSTQYMF